MAATALLTNQKRGLRVASTDYLDMRLLRVPVWMARELDVEWRLVNLVSQLHSREQADPTPFINSLLPLAFQKRFVRYDWEGLVPGPHFRRAGTRRAR
jgi:hypothetical protein